MSILFIKLLNFHVVSQKILYCDLRIPESQELFPGLVCTRSYLLCYAMLLTMHAVSNAVRAKLVELCCWSYAVGAMLLELCCWSYAVRAMLLELRC